MDHYSHADRTALARAAVWLMGRCDCHGSMPQGPNGTAACRPARDTARLRLRDGTTYCAFEPGSGVMVGPTGSVEYYRAVAPPRRGRPALRLAVPGSAFEVPGMSGIGVGPEAAGPGGRAPKAPLPAAFRVCRLANGRPRRVRFRVAVRGKGGIAARTEEREVGQPRAGSVRIPRRAFAGRLPPHPHDMGRDLAPIVEAYEDGMCLGLLEGLAGAGETYRYRWSSTLADLAGFVSSLNAARPRALRLDTVLVNYGMYLTLFGNDRRTGGWESGYPFYGGRPLYQNMSVLGGIAFLHHPGIPHDAAYALSSAQGPVFVHGPSTIDSSGDGIEISRHCGIAEPPRGAPGCPWGVRFGVEGERDGGDGWREGAGRAGAAAGRARQGSKARS